MFRSSIKTWLLIGYLVLLVNLGPSLHRAHFFNFHSLTSAGESVAVTGCSCLAHGTTVDTQAVSSSHECPFCEFFDKYNVVVDAPNLGDLQTQFFLRVFDGVQAPFVDSVPMVARGPPAV